MSTKLTAYFNKQPRIGTLSTADKGGKVNCAPVGSPRMTDEKTVVLMLGNNRTLANLKENPYAVFAIMEPAETVPKWKGIRVYLKMTDCKPAGERTSVTLEVYDIRPIVDSGQGWMASI